MKAMVVVEPGGLEQLQMRELPDPVAGPGEVVIDISYTACNWGDIEKREGTYPAPMTYPLVIGTESIGRISALGKGVSHLQVGQRVSAIHLFGGYAGKVAVPSEYVIPLPDEMPEKLGAVWSLVSLTAYHLVNTAYQAKAGDTILVHAIGGAVGLMTTQIATEMGVNVIGTVSRAGKGDRALEFGAKRVINRSEEDFVQVALDFTNGKGVDMIIDSIGGETCMRSFDALRHFGHLINIGEADEFVKEDNLRDKLYERSTSFAGYEADHAMHIPGAWEEGIKYVTERLIDGRLKLPVVAEFALEDAQEAHKLLESRTVSGKVLLAVNPVE